MSTTRESGPDSEPLLRLTLQGRELTLLGTAHVSRASAEAVQRLLQQEQYDAVAVELCPSRYNALMNPDALAKMDLFQVVREGKVAMVAANLALGAYQQRMAEQFGIEPGAEMRMAVKLAREQGLPVMLVDREIGTTLKRVYRNVSWWQRMYLMSGLLASLLTSEKVSEEEIERLKQGDILESAFSQFAEQSQHLYLPLINERDRYMTARLREELARTSAQRVLVVVGAGHVAGMSKTLQGDAGDPAQEIAELDAIPAASRWPQLIPWTVVGLVLVGFVVGFMRSPAIGWHLVLEWIVFTGGLAALGSLVAGARLLTIISAALSAPITTLNPALGVGMITAAVEIYLQKPRVEDFSRLRKDVTTPVGWWRNRVSRVLLVFMFSSLGAVIGTYIAGYRIFDTLVS